MADIASSDVTYTLSLATGGSYRGVKGVMHNAQKTSYMTVAFGNGTLTYPSGGVPLDKEKLGMKNSLVELVVVDPGNAVGYVFKWDRANNKIRIYQGDNNNVADAPLIELVAATDAPAASSLVVKAIGF